MHDSSPLVILEYLLNEFNRRNLAFVEVNEGYIIGGVNDIKDVPKRVCEQFKSKFTGKWITNFGYNKQTGNEAISSGIADFVAFGWLYVTNDNLVERFQKDLPLNSKDNIKDKEKAIGYFYGGDHVGYTDLSVYEL
jgi:N-ethylmaleimide reductase